MFGFIKNFFIKKLIVGGVVVKLDATLKKLPQNDAKTITGILIACVGLVLSSLPETAPFVQPVLDYLATLPSEQIVAGGIAYGVVGAFHKLLKLVLLYVKPEHKTITAEYKTVPYSVALNNNHKEKGD